MSPKEKQATAKLAFAFSGRIYKQISKKVQSQRFAMCTATVQAFSYSIKKKNELSICML